MRILGLSIGLPPVIHFGNKEQQQRVCGPCLMGEKVICLAITEPSAGSDVANLKTTAVKTPDGKHYIVNGEKKWSVKQSEERQCCEQVFPPPHV